MYFSTICVYILCTTIRICYTNTPFLDMDIYDKINNISANNWSISIKTRLDNVQLTAPLHEIWISRRSRHPITRYDIDNLCTLSFIIILSGDVARNPGPVNNPCSVCSKPVAKTHRAVKCYDCKLRCHIKCGGISVKNFNHGIDHQWTCPTCCLEPTTHVANSRKELCPECNKGFNCKSKISKCELCNTKFHRRCSGPKRKVYTSFTCNKCICQSMPFYNTATEEVISSTESSDHSGQNPDIYKTLPSDATTENYDCFKRKGLHFVHMNIRSLIPKISELRIFAAQSKPAVLALTETWLDETVLNSEVNIDGYTINRKDRCRNGGGVCLFVRDDIAYNCRSDTPEETEVILVDILLPKTKPITVGSIYRPPKDSTFLDKLEKVFSLLRSDCESCIMGDINIDLNQRNSSLCKKYEHVLKLYGFSQLIDKVTRFSKNSSSLIDHILCNTADSISQSGTLNIGLSDHVAIYCTRKITRMKFGTHNTIKIRSMKSYSKELLLNILNQTDWSTVVNCNNVNICWMRFKKIFLNILDDISPVKQIRLKYRTVLNHG